MSSLQFFSTSSIFILLAFFSGHADAAITAKAAVSYTSHSSTDSGTTSTTSRMIYDVGAYYKFQGGGWVLGGLYQNDTTSSTGTVDRTSYGVSGGWMAPRDSGFFVIGTYFISSNAGDFKDGNGYQADLGYKFTPSKIPVGMQISYKSYTYSKYDHSDTYIDPYFIMVLDF